MGYKIDWDKLGERYFEAGVDRGVLYLLSAEKKYDKGFPWNGLKNVTEKPSGAEPSPKYADNIKYLNLVGPEDYAFGIEAFTYPDEFEACDGSASPVKGLSIGQQRRELFGFSYRTKLGNDVDGEEHAYKLHLVYNCLASPSEKSFGTINESTEEVSFNWDCTTTPVVIEGHKPSAVLTINSKTVDAAKLAELEKILYGTAATTEPQASAVEPRLPWPDEVITLLKAQG